MTPTPGREGPARDCDAFVVDACGVLAPRLVCGLPFHPDHPHDHEWVQATNLRTANAQEGANRNANPEPPPAEQNEGAPPARADEPTAQTLTQDEIRWQVQEVYAVAYGNSTGPTTRDRHLDGLRAVADLLIDRHRRY